MSIGNLFYWHYWFSLPRVTWGTTFWLWFGFFSLFLAAAIVLRIVRNYKQDNLIREVLRRYSNIGIGMGLLGLLWFFFRQQSAPILSWRFWLLVWLVGLAYWLYLVIRYHVKRLPEIRKEKEQRTTFNKYLPQRKK